MIRAGNLVIMVFSRFGEKVSMRVLERQLQLGEKASLFIRSIPFLLQIN